MKRILALFLTVILMSGLCTVLTSAVSASSGNLLKNGDFEDSDLSDWTVSHALLQETSPDYVKSGSASVGVYVPSTYFSMTQDVTLEVGKRYEFSIYAKAESGTPEIRILLRGNNLPVVDAEGVKYVNVIGQKANAEGWTKFSGDYVNTGTVDCAVQISFDVFGFDGNYQVYFDDASMVENNTLINGSFDEGLEGWDSQGSVIEKTLETADVHDGAGAAKLTTDGWACFKQNIILEPVTIYNFSFWIKCSTTMNVRMLLHNGTNLPEGSSTDGVVYLQNVTLTPDTWTKVSYQYAYSAAAQVTVPFVIDTVSAGTMIVDDVNMEIVEGLQNGDFENGPESWTLNAGTITDSADSARTGSWAYWSTTAYDVLQQKIKLEPGKTYLFEYYAKSISGNPSMRLILESAELPDKDEYNCVYPVNMQPIAPEEDWVKISGVYTYTGTQPIFVSLRLDTHGMGNSCTVCIDDVKMETAKLTVSNAGISSTSTTKTFSAQVSQNYALEDGVTLIMAVYSAENRLKKIATEYQALNVDAPITFTKTFTKGTDYTEGDRVRAYLFSNLVDLTPLCEDFE